jgi:hypothetical protein
MSEQPKKLENQDDSVETAEVGDDDLEAVSGGLPNGAMTTQDEGVTGYSALS